MSATPIQETPPQTPPTPAPVVEAEQKVESAVPGSVQPEVQAIDREFNAAVADAESKAPAARQEAAAKTPGVDRAATDAGTIAHGGKVSSGALVGDVEAVVKEVKAGYKTTEFWGSLAIIVLTQVGTFNFPGKYGDTIAQTATAAAYVLSRGLAKYGVNKA